MNQLVFKFPFKTIYYEQDSYVSSNNFSAYKLIESWPSWPGKWLNIFGSNGSGKTHLSKILEKKIKKIKLVKAEKVDDKILEELSVFEVIKICFISFFFSNFSTNGIILSISPTLAPWNQTNFPDTLLFE